MGICMKLAIRSLQKNKGRTMVTLFGIVLSVLLVCTVFTLLNSMLCSAIDSITAKDGDWHIAVYNVTEKEALEYKEINGVERVEIVVVNGQETCRLTLKNPKDVYSFAEHYFEGQVEYAYHTELLSYLGVSQRDNVKNLILGIAIALLFIIFIGGVSLIYNAFAISVSERTREIGLLSSIGATKQDIGAIIFQKPCCWQRRRFHLALDWEYLFHGPCWMCFMLLLKKSFTLILI